MYKCESLKVWEYESVAANYPSMFMFSYVIDLTVYQLDLLNPICPGGGGADLPPPSCIRVYACMYVSKRADFLWLFLTFSMEEDTKKFFPEKNSPFSQELKKLVKFGKIS